MSDTPVVQAPELPSEPLLDVQGVSDLIGISVSTIYEWCAAGKFPYIRLGGAMRFDRASIAAWIDARRVEPRKTRARRRA